MKRVHILEFEDLPWFPAWLRDCLTRVLVVFSRVIGSTSAVANLVSRICAEQGLDAIIDLGSGSGGVMPEVVDEVRKNSETRDVTLTMTDLYPNRGALERFDADERDYIGYQRESLDATALASAPAGLKTMVNSFHHMRPEQARCILEAAHDNRQPLLIYELADNKIPFVAWLLGLVIGLPLVAVFCMVLTPWARPMTWRQVVFTYVLPVIPAFYAWDGQASMMRIYTFDDLDVLLDGLDSSDYRWEKGYAMGKGNKKAGTYLLGMPKP